MGKEKKEKSHKMVKEKAHKSHKSHKPHKSHTSRKSHEMHKENKASTLSRALKAPKTATAIATTSNGTGNHPEQNGIWRDERFQHLLADPRFRGVPKTQRKVKIDERFQGMFTDDKFKVKYTVDKYGRPVNKSNAEDLSKFYELDNKSDSEEEELRQDDATDDEEEDQQRRAEELAIAGLPKKSKAKELKRELQQMIKDATADKEQLRAEELAFADLKKNRKKATKADSDSDSDSDDSDSELLTQSLHERLNNPNVDYARGEGRLMTDSSSSSEGGSSDDEDDEGPELQMGHVWGELDNDAESTDESSRRLALCYMDWDRIRAEDLMVLFSSFLPPGGSVLSIKIYPSEFGKERMAEEDVHGPKELVERREEYSDNSDDDEEEELVREQDSDAEEGDYYHMEKLRQYQLNRLRYYFAVVEFDSIASADKVYQECDGIEYESSATRIDLRFIPDDATFDEDSPTDECYELPDASSYKPRQFTTTALQQAKVDLTWDETSLNRRELGEKLSSGQVDKLTDKELRQIVAYSTEEESTEAEEEEEEEPYKEKNNNEKPQPQQQGKKLVKPSKQERIASYKSLLNEILENEKQQQNQKYEMQMSWNVMPVQMEKDEEEQEQARAPPAMTPIEKALQKRSDKNKLRKEQRRQRKLEAKGGEQRDGNDSDASLMPDGIDLNDAYFAEEFANGDYAPLKTKHDSKKHKSKGKHSREENEAQEQQARELELLLDDGDGRHEKQHFSLSKILKQQELEQSAASGSKRKRQHKLKKSKRKQEESPEKPDDDFLMDVKDARFKAVYKSHDFNIDPTHSHYKPTKGMQRMIDEKLKRRQKQVEGGGGYDDDDEEPEPAPKRSKQQLEQKALVKSLKRKIQQQKEQ